MVKKTFKIITSLMIVMQNDFFHIVYIHPKYFVFQTTHIFFRANFRNLSARIVYLGLIVSGTRHFYVEKCPEIFPKSKRTETQKNIHSEIEFISKLIVSPKTQ